MLRFRDDIQLLTTQDDGVTVFVVRDPVTKETFQFDEIEAFLLESLRVPRGFQELAHDAAAKFGVKIAPDAVQEFVETASGWGLLERTDNPMADAASEPKLIDKAPGGREHLGMVAGQAKARGEPSVASQRAARVVPSGSDTTGAEPTDDDLLEELLPEMMPRAVEVAGRRGRRAGKGRQPRRTSKAFQKKGHWSLFGSEAMFNALAGMTRPVGGLIFWGVWGTLIAASLAVYHNLGLLALDIGTNRQTLTLVLHVLLGMFTVHLMAQLATGTVLAANSVAVTSFGIRLVLGIIPRFDVRAGDVDDLPRGTRLRIFASPLLARLGVLGICSLAWLADRGSGTHLSSLFLSVAAIALLSFFLRGNPLMKNEGYRFLTAFVDEPLLREKANRALFRGRPEDRLPNEAAAANRAALRIYALACFIFLFAFFGVILVFVARWLQLNFQGTGVAIFLLLLTFLLLRLRRRIKALIDGQPDNRKIAGQQRLRQSDDRQTETRSSRAVESMGESSKKGRWGLRRALLLVLLALVLALPYPYETGGRAEVFGVSEYDVYAENPGILEQVSYDGGEWVKKGTVIARLASHQQKKDFATTEAAILEQQAHIDKLKTTPRPEEVLLAEQRVKTADVRAQYSAGTVERLKPLYEKGNVSLEDYSDAKSERDLDIERALEERANLAMVMSGVHPKELAAAEAELERLQEELEYHRDQLQRTALRMPADGRPVGLKLSQELGRYLDRGDLFTRIIDDRTARVELLIPESDIGEIQRSSPARVRVYAHPNKTFLGEVTEIAPAVEQESFGGVVRVVVQIPNEDGLLKSGMAGFGKVSGGTKPVLVAFTRTIVRFFLVEAWSWLP